MTRLVGCFLLVLGIAATADAQCVVRTRATYAYPTYSYATYQTPVVAAYFTPLVVATVPAYSATFGAPDQGQQALIAELKALRSEVKALRSVQPGAAPEKLGAPKNGNLEQEVLGILHARCAECHTGKGAKGEFAMFLAPGQADNWTPQQIGKMLINVQQGTMPPAPRKSLNDEEFSKVNLGLASKLAQTAAK